MSSKNKIERIGFGIMADRDTCSRIFIHSDRFLVFDLKNRKDILLREYRSNPYAEVCKDRYPTPSVIGDNPSEEELEIYRKTAEILKDCTTVWGRYPGNYFVKAIEDVGSNFIMSDEDPDATINSLIEDRSWAGYLD